MLKLLETLWSSLWLGGCAIVLAVGGYIVLRYAEQWGRQAARAAADGPRLVRWLDPTQYTAADFIWRYRLAGVGAFVMAGVFLVLAVVNIVRTVLQLSDAP
jgi:glycerol uptake facilitator-like aquaporin